MARQTIPQNNFNNGELSPRCFGRFDWEKYPNSAKKIENFLINQLGGVQFCPGSRYVASTKTASAKSHLIPFQYNAAQAYILELGSLYMRFYTQGAQVVVPASDPIDTYTKFLAHFDGSQNQQTYTPEVGPAISFVGNAALDVSTEKFGVSSLKFPGGTDNITIADDAGFNFSNGDFAIDFWINPTSNQDTNYYLQFVDLNNFVVLKRFSNKLVFWAVSGGVTQAKYTSNSSFSPTVGSWNHVEIDRNGTNFYVWLNGAAVSMTANTAISTNTLPDLAASVQIGTSTQTEAGGIFYFTGYMDEYRVSKGIARHTSTFTPNTAAYGGPAAWVTSTVYNVGDYVNQSQTIYRCLIAHTSGTFATDLAAGDWIADAAYEIVTPYALADVPNIHFSQNADVMYLYHKSYPTQKLTRISATSFTIAEAPFIRGPFLNTNSSAITINPDADTGTGVNLVASAALFVAGHVGALFRIKNGVVKITAVTNATTAVGSVQLEPSGAAGNLGSATVATLDWAEGAFSSYRGYAFTGTFHQQRHYVSPETTQKVFGTYLGAYDNFKTDANDASAAVSFDIVSSQVNSVKWLDSDTEFMDAGTSGGVFPVSSGNQGTTITAANIKASKDTSYGAFSTPPKRISSYLYYIHKSLMRIYELAFNVVANRQLSKDMTLTADHILRDGQGALDLDYQQTPYDRIWVVRNDGQLAIMTRNVEQEIVGWSRRIAGRDSTTTGVYESITIIQQESQDDQVWVQVKRIINGSTVRFIEYFTLENYTCAWDPVLLDASLSYNSPITISGATKASPVVVTANAHGFSNGDYVKIDKVVGMTNLNGNTYIVAGVGTNSFQLTDTNGVNIDGTAFTTYISGGEVRKKVTTLTGLSHLNGETVSVQIDGDIPSTETYLVSGGSITLSDRAAVAHVGLPYTGTIEFLKPNGVGKTGTGHEKKKRIYQIDFKVFQTSKFKIAASSSRTAFDVNMPSSAQFYSGDIHKVSMGAGWGEDDTAVITQTKPRPTFILACFFGTDIEEKE